MSPKLEIELQRYISLPKSDKVLWLSYLMYSFTMNARGYYEVGTDGVEDPVALRRSNEFAHRIAEFQISVLQKQEHTIPDDIFFAMLYEVTKGLNINVDSIIDFIRQRVP